MNDEQKIADTPSETRATMAFSYKTHGQHAHAMLKYWKATLLTAVSVFGGLWVFAQASIYFLGTDLRGWWYCAVGVVVSVLAAFLRTLYVYLNECPEGLETESAVARKLAQIQRPHWEFRLARELLEDNLGRLDEDLADLLEGRVFVPCEEEPNVTEYLKWARTRPENVKRMLEVAKRLVVVDFPGAICSTEAKPGDPATILAVTERLRDLYAGTVAFERENQSVAPPEALQTLHRLQCGWTAPIRDGIHQLFAFLDRIISFDPKSDHRLEFTIEFLPPTNSDAFCAELDRLTPQIPRILYDEMAP